MRKKLPAGEPMLIDKLDDGLVAAIKSELLNAVASEPETPIRRQICDTVSELAVVLIAGGMHHQYQIPILSLMNLSLTVCNDAFIVFFRRLA